MPPEDQNNITPNPAPSQSAPVVETPVSQPMPVAPTTGKTFDIKKFITSKMGMIIGGAVIVIALVITGLVVFKTPLAQVASNIGISGIKLTDYNNDKFKFSIKAPEGWETTITDTSYDSLGLAYIAMDEPIGDLKDKSAANTHFGSMRISVNDSSKVSYGQKDEAKYFSDVKKSILSAVTNKSTTTDSPTYSVDSESAATVNGLSAYKVKMKVNNYDYQAGESGYQYELSVFVSKSLSYKVEVSAHTSETDVISKADAILDSFKAL